MSDFTRPKDVFRFAFAGFKTNAAPNSLPPSKYNLAINVRAYDEDSIRTRPGLTLIGSGLNLYTDIQSYSLLQTDNLPRILARDTADNILLADAGIAVSGLAGGGLAPGAAMIPFRPGQSPQAWMYIANGFDYQKFPAPVGNVVPGNGSLVGIVEPQAPVDAAPLANVTNSIGPLNTMTNSGNAGAVAVQGTGRANETIVAAFADSTPGSALYTIQVPGATQYQIGELVAINAYPILNPIRDVFQPLIPTSIKGIFYFSGTTGQCVVVPNVTSDRNGDNEESIYTQFILANLRRGALVKIGSEVCLVQSVTTGPDGSICFETSTTLAHTTADTLSGVPAFQIALTPGQPVPAVGQTITAGQWSFQVTTGIGSVVSPIANLFTQSGGSFQEDDYIHISINVDNLANLTEIKIVFDVDKSIHDFLHNAYYYAIRPNDLVQAIANQSTQLGIAQTISQRAFIDEESAAESRNQGKSASSAQTTTGNGQWAEILFPISALTRIGNDPSVTINNQQSTQILVNCSGTVNILLSSISVRGQFQPDVGDVGSPFKYRVRPRNLSTGVVGNPSPEMRYGVSPRREQVIVTIPVSYPDPQVTVWDVFRYGGSVTSYRFIGTIPTGAGNFSDNFSDDAAEAGDALDFDNFQPWPSVDLPQQGVNITIVGTVGILQLTPDNPNWTRYLPGTEVQLSSQNVYTLWNRPVSLGGGQYLVRFSECANIGPPLGLFNTFLVQEPALANQMLPYMWGPDAGGTIFAVGDPLRPGTLYFAKNYAPDSAPDNYNIEVVDPSEPLQGGIIVDGLSFVGTPERWWALYPQPDNPLQRYNPVQTPDQRGIVSPYGVATDGKQRFWWAKDGIWSSEAGSLTDADLYPLFPHEGVKGKDHVYAGVTIQAPDYSQVKRFRLTYSNGYLYAIYRTTDNHYRMLVLDVRRGAWMVDQYYVEMSAALHIDQQPSSGSTLNPVLLFAGQSSLGTNTGALYKQTDSMNDNATPITPTLASFEFDGGDLRAPKQWGDFFLDVIPAAAGPALPASGASMQAQLVSQGAGVGPPAPVGLTRNNLRVRFPLDLGGVVISDFAGLLLQWVDDFGVQPVATRVFAWQPSFVIQPARGVGWYTFGTNFTLDGFMHIREALFAYVSAAPITLTPVSFDGLDPAPIVLPSTGGVYKKVYFPFSANKGLLYNFTMKSPQPFQIFLDDSEIHVGQWNRNGPYVTVKKFDDVAVEQGVV